MTKSLPRPVASTSSSLEGSAGVPVGVCKMALSFSGCRLFHSLRDLELARGVSIVLLLLCGNLNVLASLLHFGVEVH